MQSELGGHVAGNGIEEAFVEHEATYVDERERVKLEHDPDGMKRKEFDAMCERLSGEVTTYYVEVE